MNRRLFFRALGAAVGFFGLSKTVSAVPAKPKKHTFKKMLAVMQGMQPGSWSYDPVERHREELKKLESAWFAVTWSNGGNNDAGNELVNLITKPSVDQSHVQLLTKLACDNIIYGRSLVWVIPNEVGRPANLYKLNAQTTALQPASEDHPFGHYAAFKQIPYPLNIYDQSYLPNGVAIPAGQVIEIPNLPSDKPWTAEDFCDRLSKAFTSRLAPKFGTGLTVKFSTHRLGLPAY